MDLVWDHRRNDYNDEGFYWSYCHTCSRKTEHESGSCCACINRRLSRPLRQVRSVKIGDYTVKVYPNGKRYCNCKGFKFRKTCKHIGMVI